MGTNRMVKIMTQFPFFCSSFLLLWRYFFQIFRILNFERSNKNDVTTYDVETEANVNSNSENYYPKISNFTKLYE